MAGKGKENINRIKVEAVGPTMMALDAPPATVLLRCTALVFLGLMLEALSSASKRHVRGHQGAGKGKRVMGGVPSSKKKSADAAELQLEQLVDQRDAALAQEAAEVEANRRTEILPLAEVHARGPPPVPGAHADG